MIYMIRIRFFGPLDLIQRFYRRAQYPSIFMKVTRRISWTPVDDIVPRCEYVLRTFLATHDALPCFPSIGFRRILTRTVLVLEFCLFTTLLSTTAAATSTHHAHLQDARTEQLLCQGTFLWECFRAIAAFSCHPSLYHVVLRYNVCWTWCVLFKILPELANVHWWLVLLIIFVTSHSMVLYLVFVAHGMERSPDWPQLRSAMWQNLTVMSWNCVCRLNSLRSPRRISAMDGFHPAFAEGQWACGRLLSPFGISQPFLQWEEWNRSSVYPVGRPKCGPFSCHRYIASLNSRVDIRVVWSPAQCQEDCISARRCCGMVYMTILSSWWSGSSTLKMQDHQFDADNPVQLNSKRPRAHGLSCFSGNSRISPQRLGLDRRCRSDGSAGDRHADMQTCRISPLDRCHGDKSSKDEHSSLRVQHSRHAWVNDWAFSHRALWLKKKNQWDSMSIPVSWSSLSSRSAISTVL